MRIYFVYILQSIHDDWLYIGQTDNLKNRFIKHNTGKVKSTKHKIPFNLVYYEQYYSRSEAMWREWELKKKYNKQRKLKLIRNFDQRKIAQVLGP